MRTLRIKNIGPINKETEIKFKRFCVLIGPQCSGKSTLAKLLSTCMWLEKEACTSPNANVLLENTDFKTLVEDYHRMHGYFSDESSLVYESDFVEISYKNSSFSLKIKKDCDYRRIKISYIPSDRNVITVDRLEQRDLASTNFRSFLFDWFTCRKYFDKKNKADILDLGFKYYYDETRFQRRDLIIPNTTNGPEISLYDASSGAQSAVPLVISSKFYSDTYFDVYDKEISFESKSRMNELMENLISINFSDENGKSGIEKFIKSKISSGDDSFKEKEAAVNKAFIKLAIPHSTTFVIEELEQNLYPKTQKELLFNLFSNFNNEHKSNALLTTHSPYVLSVINILMFAGMIKQKLTDKKEFSELYSLVPEQSIISHDEIEVYSVSNGTCTSIKDIETGLISMNELDSVSEDNSSLFDELYSLFISKVN